MRFYTNVQMVGDHFLVRGYENGRHFATREKFYPTLFVPSNKETKYKTLEGDYVESIDPGTVRDCREFIKKYDGVQNFKVYGNDRYIYQYISEMYPEEVKFDKDLIKIFTVDIECSAENGFPDIENPVEELLAITVKNQSNKQIITWGVGDFHTDRVDVTYVKCKDEKQLMFEFMNFWMKNYPDVITGWNTKFFDLPYLMNRIILIAGDKVANKISPWGLFQREVILARGRPKTIYDIKGITNLDYLDLYQWFSISDPLQRHPFSGLVHSAGELLHTP